MATESPIDHVLHEVQDMPKHWVFFERFLDGKSLDLPAITIAGYTFHITKFMVLELIAAGLMLLIFIPLSRRIRTGELPRGRFWNFFESILLFIRDEIARPALDNPHKHDAAHAHEHGHGEHHPPPAHTEHPGHDTYGGHVEAGQPRVVAEGALEEHEADKFLPYLWTLFFFILILNLLGLVPFMGSATGSIWVTGALAMISFVMIHGAAIYKKHGDVLGYLKGMVPHIDMPVIGAPIGYFIFAIEMLGTLIKSVVLAIRLFANMFAGHMVLGFILFFIYLVGSQPNANPFLWGSVSFLSVMAAVGLSLLELFVAFLQAYVFTFLTALFMGMSLYPEH